MCRIFKVENLESSQLGEFTKLFHQCTKTENIFSKSIFFIGQYHVALPDGRTQIVTNTSDHVNGYIADVKY